MKKRKKKMVVSKVDSNRLLFTWFVTVEWMLNAYYSKCDWISFPKFEFS
ncbi:hypothetical protein V7O66_03025 [Methanolobus sp. ZRKC3]